MEQPFEFLRQSAAEFCSLGDSYACARYTSASDLNDIVKTVKIDGIVLLIVKEGSVEFEVNMERHSAGRDSIIVFNNSALLNSFKAETKRIDIYMICFSIGFLHNVNINYAVINLQSFVDRNSPAETLAPDETAVILRYYNLLRDNALYNISPKIETYIAASLAAAMIYQLVLLHYRSIGSSSSTSHRRNGRSTFVRDFIKLVHVHYSSERSVAFYADQLCISSKYLSLLVKEATGKSAARWIDDFVIMEAKNLLRYSGKNVQQVAYALNFPNQSSFGKFFKHLTGQSPTAYQKS